MQIGDQAVKKGLFMYISYTEHFMIEAKFVGFIKLELIIVS
jgi:hypothetical protein